MDGRASSIVLSGESASSRTSESSVVCRATAHDPVTDYLQLMCVETLLAGGLRQKENKDASDGKDGKE